jgi:nucleolar pre-ribosomal-associated protein 1
MAVLEQFHAKMMGQHLSTDAAVVILGYFRRVLLGLMGKMDDKTFLDAVTGRLEETRVGAKEKGQGRPGVETLIEAIRRDVKAVFEIGSKADEVGVFTEAVDFPRLVDEQ